MGKLDIFFGGPWNTMVKTYKYPIVGMFLIWTIVASIFASKLSPLTKEEEFLPSDHPLSKITDIVN